MNDKPGSAHDDEEAIERDIVEHRKFTWTEAMGRMGAGELMKGASPITRKRQAELAIEAYLEQHLRDTEGALERVLLREVATSRLLLEQFDQPLVALVDYCQRLLDSSSRWSEFVRLVDVEWGRMYQERPRFDRPDRPPAADDPYTQDSTRRQVERLLAALAEL